MQIAAELIKRGLPVLSTNQRTVAETEATLAMLRRVAGRETEVGCLLAEFRERLAPVNHRRRSDFNQRTKNRFETAYFRNDPCRASNAEQ
jgi:ABC-type Fe3+-hydroxamate transport system substrate-binding protein